MTHLAITVSIMEDIKPRASFWESRTGDVNACGFQAFEPFRPLSALWRKIRMSAGEGVKRQPLSLFYMVPRHIRCVDDGVSFGFTRILVLGRFPLSSLCLLSDRRGVMFAEGPCPPKVMHAVKYRATGRNLH